MCTQYYIRMNDPDMDEIRERFFSSRLTERFRSSGAKITEGGIVRPSLVVPVVAPDKTAHRAVYPMKWGFSLGKKLIVNARSETAESKPMFRDHASVHRCAVPASFYFEWRHDKETGKMAGERPQKYAFRIPGENILWLGGLYRMENGLPSFTVLTRDASPELSDIHPRMPFIIPGNMLDEWTEPGTRDISEFETVTDLEFTPVDPGRDGGSDNEEE